MKLGVPYMQTGLFYQMSAYWPVKKDLPSWCQILLDMILFIQRRVMEQIISFKKCLLTQVHTE
jgi:hypothetical protein